MVRGPSGVASMAHGQRHRRRSRLGLSVLLGLLVAGIPVGDRCRIAAAEASCCHLGPEDPGRPSPLPSERSCCDLPDEAVPARPTLPAQGSGGSHDPCRSRTSSCCCPGSTSQAVAERGRSTRAVTSRPAEATPLLFPASPAAGRAFRIVRRPSPPTSPKVPLYLRTARLRN
jgi:hypothetical protein